MFGESAERQRGVPEPVEGTFTLMEMRDPVPELAEGRSSILFMPSAGSGIPELADGRNTGPGHLEQMLKIDLELHNC